MANPHEKEVLTLGMKGIFHQSITIPKIIESPLNKDQVTMITLIEGPRMTENEGVAILILEKVFILDLAIF